ncbi:hypothetical protein TNCV_4385271 [Trichonephila clavipes]|nr:hypothetical protein TNCV_4385271 [Trichonephila clavipes]
MRGHSSWFGPPQPSGYGSEKLVGVLVLLKTHRVETQARCICHGLMSSYSRGEEIWRGRGYYEGYSEKKVTSRSI